MTRLFVSKFHLATKFISVYCLVIFLLGSGAGQLIHCVFHNHNFECSQQTATTTINLPHSYCNALQLMLPEFSESGVISVPAEILIQSSSFSHVEITIRHSCSFKTSDRAPPVSVQLFSNTI
jgi:hypothetical protein